MIDFDIKVSGYQEILRFCAHFNAYKRHSNIHSNEIDALLFIDSNAQEVTPRMLADYFNVSKPRITKIINALSKQGYLIKLPSKKDGRSQVLSLSEQGKKLLADKERECYKIIDELVKELGFGDFVQLTELLIKANGIIYK